MESPKTRKPNLGLVGIWRQEDEDSQKTGVMPVAEGRTANGCDRHPVQKHSFFMLVVLPIKRSIDPRSLQCVGRVPVTCSRHERMHNGFDSRMKDSRIVALDSFACPPIRLSEKKRRCLQPALTRVLNGRLPATPDRMYGHGQQRNGVPARRLQRTHPLRSLCSLLSNQVRAIGIEQEQFVEHLSPNVPPAPLAQEVKQLFYIESPRVRESCLGLVET